MLWPLLLRGRKQKDSKLIRWVLEVLIEFSKNLNNYDAILELKKEDGRDVMLAVLESLMNYENPEVARQVVLILKNFSGSDVALRRLREKGIIERCMRLKLKELGSKSELCVLEMICNACSFSKVRQDAMESHFVKQVF